MSNIFFNMDKNVRNQVNISQSQAYKLINTVTNTDIEDNSSSNYIPCIACPSSKYTFDNLNEEQKDNKYTNILDTNLILKNKYSING